jgi:hypothetical protein
VVGNLTNLTDSRPDYPTAVAILFGDIDPHLTSYGEIAQSASARLVKVAEDKWPVLKTRAPSGLREEISRLSSLPLRGAACFSDRDYPRFLELTQSLFQIDPSLRRAIELSLNKGALYERFSERHVPTGAFFRVGEEAAIAAAIDSLKREGREVIVKPSVSTGSAGVYKPILGESGLVSAEKFPATFLSWSISDRRTGVVRSFALMG